MHHLSIKLNNSAPNDPCAICGTPTDPECGSELFLDGTNYLVCHTCTERDAPELLAALLAYRELLQNAEHDAGKRGSQSQLSPVNSVDQSAILRNQNSQLICPVCGFNYVHPVKAGIELGHVTALATEDTVQVSGTDRHKHCRGSVITLTFRCESGHQFQYVLRFEKGHTYFDLRTGNLDEGDLLSELWRN